MNSNRKPTEKEDKLIDLLVKKSGILLPPNWKNELTVQTMDDGGMGSLLLFPKKEIKTERLFGEQISEFFFKDKDGVDVIASLYVDKDGDLYELDMWKTDFSPLISLPDKLIDKEKTH